jgi:hypothetical protein
MEAEQAVAVSCAQDMLFVMRLMESMGLKVQKPMVLKLDNKGAHDIAHTNWTIGGRTRNVDVRMHFLRESKEEGLIVTDWISGESNPSDLFTKNLAGPAFEKHTQYSNSQGGSTQIQTANQQQTGQPKLGGKKCVSNTTIDQKMQGFLHRSKRELWD